MDPPASRALRLVASFPHRLSSGTEFSTACHRIDILMDGDLRAGSSLEAHHYRWCLIRRLRGTLPPLAPDDWVEYPHPRAQEFFACNAIVLRDPEDFDDLSASGGSSRPPTRLGSVGLFPPPTSPFWLADDAREQSGASAAASQGRREAFFADVCYNIRNVPVDVAVVVRAGEISRQQAIGLRELGWRLSLREDGTAILLFAAEPDEPDDPLGRDIPRRPPPPCRAPPPAARRRWRELRRGRPAAA